MTNQEKPIDDNLDQLLSEWHDEHRVVAERGRDDLLGRISRQEFSERSKPDGRPSSRRVQSPSFGGRRLFGSRGTGLLAAALFAMVAMIAVLALPINRNQALADVIMIPEGGRLEALLPDGTPAGPCPLQHTAVDAHVTGMFLRVNVAQEFKNIHQQKIEAVYTFPLGRRGAVDRMIMTVTGTDGEERVVVGEVKERSLARRIYEQARDQGYVASLLEQERPNIFTQSVANIEPGSSVKVEISYVEVLKPNEEGYAFEFPTVVGPRYIPGRPQASSVAIPEDAVIRPGIVLQGPAEFRIADPDQVKMIIDPEGFLNGTAEVNLENWPPEQFEQVMHRAIPVKAPDWSNDSGSLPFVTGFNATYGDGTTEIIYLYGNDHGVIYANSNGVFTERWFIWQRPNQVASGNGFSPDTDQVPDASRITPMPVKPSTRAGHDISINVTLDTGGVPITEMDAPLHEIVKSEKDGLVKVSLKNQKTIPNRDFVLQWKLKDESIQESVFTHVVVDSENLRAGADSSAVGGYLSMMLAPPARVEEDTVRSRELIFVLDTSGSMSGFPLDKSKEVVRKAIAAMRPSDTFNVITFAGNTHVLWESPRAATETNLTEADAFIADLRSQGGTEMMKAMSAALVQEPIDSDGMTMDQLVNLPADGRRVSVQVPLSAIVRDESGAWLVINDALRIPMTMSVSLPFMKDKSVDLVLEGNWQTADGLRRFDVITGHFVSEPPAPAMRIAMFFTDGYVGNEGQIIQMIRENAGTTRVFGLGIGDSVNRYLMDGMSAEGRGAVEYVLLNTEADEAVARLSRRIQTPVLTDIEVRIEGIEVTDVLPRNRDGLLPDLFDEEPISFFARFVPPAEGVVKGKVFITGNTGNGRYERTIDVEFPAVEEQNDVVSTLWARAKVDEVIAPHRQAVEQRRASAEIKNKIVALGETYSIMTPYTSFVAVEKSRVTIKGKPVLVNIPIELPSGTSWSGFFGPDCPPAVLARGRALFGGDLIMEVSDPSVRPQLDQKSEKNRSFGFEGNSAANQRPAPAGRAAPGAGAAFGSGGGAGGGLGMQSGKTTTSTKAGVGMAGSRSRGRSRSRGIPVPPPAAPEGAVFEADDAAVDALPDMDLGDSNVIGATTAEESAEEVVTKPASKLDLARIWKVLDQSLLMLALGANPDDVKGLPRMGVDGRPFLDKGTVEVTVLWDQSIGGSKARKAMETSGLSIEGSAKGASLAVGRIAIGDLLELAQVEGIRRIAPTSIN